MSRDIKIPHAYNEFKLKLTTQQSHNYQQMKGVYRTLIAERIENLQKQHPAHNTARSKDNTINTKETERTRSNGNKGRSRKRLSNTTHKPMRQNCNTS